MSAAIPHVYDGRHTDNLTLFPTLEFSVAEALSIAVISPNAERRAAAVRALDNCTNGRIRVRMGWSRRRSASPFAALRRCWMR